MQWSLHEAKNRFSAVVEAAGRGEPQTVTKRGEAAVVVLSVAEYRRLKQLEHMQMPSFAEHLLALPTDDGEDDFERMDITPRELAL